MQLHVAACLSFRSLLKNVVHVLMKHMCLVTFQYSLMCIFFLQDLSMLYSSYAYRVFSVAYPFDSVQLCHKTCSLKLGLENLIHIHIFQLLFPLACSSSKTELCLLFFIYLRQRGKVDLLHLQFTDTPVFKDSGFNLK